MLQRLQITRRWLLALPLLAALALCCLRSAAAQGVDLGTLRVERPEGAITLDFAARLQLSPTVEDALQRGVPVYFVAQAALYRNRWYWRDERVARVTRSWRLAYQPLTSTWRVGIGAISQSYPTLPEALAVISRTSGWKLAEAAQVDPDARHYIEFEFRLDTSQLPSPMQIGLTGQADWQLGVERTLRVDNR